MLNKAEQTTQTIMTKYEDDVQQLTRQVQRNSDLFKDIFVLGYF